MLDTDKNMIGIDFKREQRISCSTICGSGIGQMSTIVLWFLFNTIEFNVEFNKVLDCSIDERQLRSGKASLNEIPGLNHIPFSELQWPTSVT
ncbi:hypothetical protein C439_12564 [Haloferax mediterranei ATCC 33500]|nr:hypothetical protein C439_12564 [Haloferax mediterranei ATCC 33500]